MDGKEIYGGDIVRWYDNCGSEEGNDEIIDSSFPLLKNESETYCKVISNIYKQKRGEI